MRWHQESCLHFLGGKHVTQADNPGLSDFFKKNPSTQIVYKLLSDKVPVVLTVAQRQ